MGRTKRADNITYTQIVLSVYLSADDYEKGRHLQPVSDPLDTPLTTRALKPRPALDLMSDED